ncbi:pentapeptide repeat-containing protein, partial [Kibdelosporangium lantanae]
LAEHHGRRDLRGFVMPNRKTRESMAGSGVIPADQVRRPEIAGYTLDGLDFTDADFDVIRFYDSELRNCVFDGIRFRDLKLWRTRVHDCSFREAKLVDAVLGALEDGVPNSYTGVDLTAADLRRAVFEYADFVDVDFSDTNLIDIDFGSATFSRCTFSGRLDQLVFWELPPDSERSVRNQMDDVDFSRAELHGVEFRGLRLDRVTLPMDDNHVVVHHYDRVLKRAIDELTGSSPYAAGFEHELRWAHPLREVGIWHRDDLDETVADLLERIDRG